MANNYGNLIQRILSFICKNLEQNIDLTEDNFEHITVSVKNQEIQSFKPLIERIEDDKIDNLIEASKSG